MKKTILLGFFISLAFVCCSCSNNSKGVTSAVTPKVSPDLSYVAAVDTHSQQQSTQKNITPATTGIPSAATGIPASDQPQSLDVPKIIRPASTTKKIVYAVNSEGFFCIYDGKKYGFINEYGSESIPFIYDKAYPFSEGLACVYKDGKYGFIDKKGTTALPFIYDKASSFHDGMAYFEIGDLYGFINEKGEKVILLNCDSVSSFNDGLAYFSIHGKYGYIDKTGKVVINAIYDDVSFFKNGAAKVRVKDKIGIINKSGQELVPIKYDDVTEENGFIIIKLNNKYGCVNAKGKIILPAKYAQVYVNQGEITYSINDKEGIIDVNGKIIKTKYYYMNKVPNSNLRIAKYHEKYGIVDKTDNVIVPFKYDEIEYEDFLSISDANDKKNTNTSVHRFSVRIGDNYGVIDEKGNIILPCKYEDTQISSKGMIVFEQNNKYRLADPNGKIVTKNEYDEITQIGDFFCFGKDSYYGFLNEKGDEIIPIAFDNISIFYNDVINSRTCFVATNYYSIDFIVVTKLGSHDDISSLILENEITPKLKLFHDYVKKYRIDISFTEDENTTNLNQMNDVSKTFKLYQLEGNDNPILYLYVKPIRAQIFPASYSEFLSLDKDKVKTLISASECGGSAGGNYVCLSKDKLTSKIVLTISDHAGGFGGNSYGYDFYNIIHGKAHIFKSYQQISQTTENYKIKVLLKNANLFYGEKNVPYTKKTISHADYVTEYEVDYKQTTIDKFNKVMGRFKDVLVNISL